MQVKGGPFIQVSTYYCVSLALLISTSVFLGLIHTLLPDYKF
jgi:fructose-1,6-bisphosphatase/inositol monophosphatase family enzyme